MILVCDDERERMEPLIDVLRLLKYDAELVSDADEVPVFLEEHHSRVDVVLLDIRMPVGSLVEHLRNRGYECENPSEHSGMILFKYIRDTYALPVVVHSVLRDLRIREFFDTRENTEFVPKPAPSIEIVEALERAIGRQNE